MKNTKKILGMLLFVLTFSLISNVKADYYRLNEFKSNDELLAFQYECQENVMCTLTPSVEAVWDENSTPTGEGRVFLGEWYAGYTYEARNFSMLLSGSVDASKNYVVSLTSDYMDSQVTYTGEEINTGITITIGESFGTLTVTVKEEGTNTNVNYWRFNNDGLLPEDITSPEEKTEEFETVYLYFNAGKQQQNPNPGYQGPQEDPEEKAKMEALLDEIAPTGKIKLDTVDPSKTNAEEGLYDSLLTAAFTKQYNVGQYNVFVFPASEYNEKPYIELDYYNYPNNTYTSYTREVEIEYAEKDETINSKLEEIRTKLNHDMDYYHKDYNNNFNITDLEGLNYYYNIQNVKNTNASYYLIPSYSSKIHELTDNVGFDFMFDPRAGGSYSLFYEPIIGPINILYNGIVVDNINPIGFTLSNILYIPSDTQKSREAFIKAAQDRIDEYFKGQNIKVEYEDDISELMEAEYSWEIWNSETQEITYKPLFDLEKTNGEFYTITIGDAVYPYFIVADSSKMNTPITKSVDMNTNVKVESGSYDVPLDTRLNVTKLDKNSEEFKKLAEKVKILDDNSYDINLLSTSLDMKIEKLSNGNFKVYIPIKEEYAEKELKAVYVKEDGTLEEHEIKVENGYAVFETDHFSTYSIEEIEEEPKEETYTADLDNIKLEFTDEAGHEFTVAIIDIFSLSKEELAKITTEEEYNKTMEELNKNFKDEGKIIGIYVIEVEDEDGNAKTEGKFQIKIKMTDEMKKYSSFKLINLNEEDNTKGEKVDLKVEGDYLVGELPHLSVYVLVGEEKTETKTETKSNNPITGDKIMKYTIILGISILGITGLTIYTKKSKKTK